MDERRACRHPRGKLAVCGHCSDAVGREGTS
jgi:hypothetical protein